MRNMLSSFLTKHKALLKEVQSLLELFAFAAKLLTIVRIFSRCFALATTGLKNPFSHMLSIYYYLNQNLLLSYFFFFSVTL